MSSFKTVAAFVGGLMLGAGALSLSSPEDRMIATNPYQADPGDPLAGGEAPDPTLGEPVPGLPAADGAAGPPPPEGTPLLPPEGAGTFLPEGMQPGEGVAPVIDGATPGMTPPATPGGDAFFSSEGKRPPPMAGVLLLDEHIKTAESRWWELRGRAKGAPDSSALLREIDALVMMIPDSDGGMPPLQEVVAFLVKERLLLDRLAASDVDASEASAALDRLLSPPKGKVKGGHERAAVPGGAGNAPDGTRPIDPDTPRRVDGAG